MLDIEIEVQDMCMKRVDELLEHRKRLKNSMMEGRNENKLVGEKIRVNKKEE